MKQEYIEKKHKFKKFNILIKFLVAFFCMFILFQQNNTQKKQFIITNAFSTLSKDEKSNNIDFSKSNIYKNEIKHIKSEIENAKKKLGNDDIKKTKMAVLHKNLSEILYKTGTTNISSVTMSPFLIDEMKEYRADFSYSDFYCKMEFNQVYDIYLPENKARELTNNKNGAGCYKYYYGDYIFQPDIKPKKRTYNLANAQTQLKFNNYGNRYSENIVDVLKKQGIKLVVVDKVFAEYFNSTIFKELKKNFVVISVATTNIESEIAILDSLASELTSNRNKLDSYRSQYKNTILKLSNKFVSSVDNQKKPKVLLVYRYNDKIFILKDNSYLASWFRNMGFDVINPDGKNNNLSIDRIEVTHKTISDSYSEACKKIAKYKNEANIIVNTLHEVRNFDWYISRDKNWDNDYYAIKSLGQIRLNSNQTIDNIQDTFKL